MRDSSHDIYAKIQRAFQERDGIRIPKVTVLWKGHQLEIQPWTDFLSDLKQCVYGRQRRIANVHMGANRKAALRHRPAAQQQRSSLNILYRQIRLDFAPETDPFIERAAFVVARCSIRQGGIHMKVAVHKWRRDEVARRVNFLSRGHVQPALPFFNLPVQAPEIDRLALTGQPSVPDN